MEPEVVFVCFNCGKPINFKEVHDYEGACFECDDHYLHTTQWRVPK